MSKSAKQVKPSIKGPITVVAAVIRNKKGQILIARRPDSHRVAGGLWEFPGGKIEAGESPDEALRREVREELGIEIKVGALIDVVSHVYTISTDPALARGPDGSSYLHILLVGYFAHYDGELIRGFKLNDVAEVEWVASEHRPPHLFAPADIPFLEKVWPNNR